MTDEIHRYYRLLELDQGPSLEDVKHAYRELAKVWHPDRFPNDAKLQHKAQERLKEINIAYGKLQEFLISGASREQARQRPKPDSKQAQTTAPRGSPPSSSKKTGKAQSKPKASARANSRRHGSSIGIVVALLVIVAAIFALNRKPTPAPQANQPPATSTATRTNLPTTEVNQALMVTVELDFGPKVPSIAEALRDIERRHQPDSGNGRVFAILDAYGEPTPDGKKLHLSMHVSTEKPGIGALVFKRTGEVLWSSRIVPSTNVHSAFSGTALTILIDNGTGRMVTVDGSHNPSSILEAVVKETGQLVSEAWPEGVEYEVTFIYSACGCPVKVKCQRIGDRTVRTKELPVIFPDDPSAVTLISRLMRW